MAVVAPPLIGRRIILIRHAATAVDRRWHPSRFQLTPEGELAADRLATVVEARPSTVAAGTEAKLVATVAPLARRWGLPVVRSRQLNESGSGGWLDPDDFVAVVERFLTRPDRPPASGWEPSAAVAARLLAAMASLSSAGDGFGPLVVCTGGRSLTAFLVAVGLVPGVRAPHVWRRLRMPELVVVRFNAAGRARYDLRPGVAPLPPSWNCAGG